MILECSFQPLYQWARAEWRTGHFLLQHKILKRFKFPFTCPLLTVTVAENQRREYSDYYRNTAKRKKKNTHHHLGHQWQPLFYHLPDPSSPQLSRGKLKINSELVEKQRERGNNLDFLRGVVITTPIFIHSSLVFRE